MNIKNTIFNNNDPSYTAKYGWQKQLKEDVFTFGYIDSYKDAADLLVDKMIPDLYIFPIMFCYRQYLEQLLKNICYKNMEKDDYKNLIKKVSHNLIQVWKVSKTFLESDVSKENLDMINEVIKIFDSLDPDSFRFRYEFDKKLNRSIKEKSLTINTFELKNLIDKIDTCLYFTYECI